MLSTPKLLPSVIQFPPKCEADICYNADTTQVPAIALSSSVSCERTVNFAGRGADTGIQGCWQQEI